MSLMTRPFTLGLAMLVTGAAMAVIAVLTSGASLLAAVAPCAGAVALAVPTWFGRARWRAAQPRTLRALVVAGLLMTAIVALVGVLAGGPAFAGLAIYLGGGAMVAGLILPAMLAPQHA